jgi:hypothetical protein
MKARTYARALAVGRAIEWAPFHARHGKAIPSWIWMYKLMSILPHAMHAWRREEGRGGGVAQLPSFPRAAGCVHVFNRS